MIVAQRQIGANGPAVSEITYGTMRMPPSIDGMSAADYLCRLHDHGIDTHHSSHEYETHESYVAALRQARNTGRSFRHIVKLSEPGFDHHRFDGRRLSTLLHRQLEALGASSITSLQWLFRTPDAQDTEARVAGLHEQHDEITGWVKEQQAAGIVHNVSVFPYSIGFARAALDLDSDTTLAAYLNRSELEYADLLDDVDGLLAIRPLGGGSLTTSPEQVQSSIRFSLLHPAVATSIVSFNSLDHLETILSAVVDLEPDRDGFNEAAQAR